MMYYLLVAHYALLKGVYGRRWKGMVSSVKNLSFLCISSLTILVVIIFIDKELFLKIYKNRLPLGPIAGGLYLILAPILYFIFSGYKVKKKVKIIRKVIILKRKFRRIHSILYVTGFVLVFIIAFLIGILFKLN